jgi:hypothetical protein
MMVNMIGADYLYAYGPMLGEVDPNFVGPPEPTTTTTASADTTQMWLNFATSVINRGSDVAIQAFKSTGATTELANEVKALKAQGMSDAQIATLLQQRHGSMSGGFSLSGAMPWIIGAGALVVVLLIMKGTSR